MNYAKPVALTTAVILFVLGVSPARAALGGDAGSVQSDAAALSGQLETRADVGQGYSVQRLSLPNGTVIDEYLSAAGTVFALIWRGPKAPDLSQLLGSYFGEYLAASAGQYRHSSLVEYKTGDLIYRSGGHMRSHWGSAELPGLVPSGLKAEDFR